MFSDTDLVELLDNLDRYLNADHINTDKNIVPKLLEAYDLAYWRCYPNEIINKMTNFLILIQNRLIPHLKKYFSEQNYFNIDVDYLVNLLNDLSASTIIALENDLFSYALRPKIRGTDHELNILTILLKNNTTLKDVIVKQLNLDKIEYNLVLAESKNHYSKEYMDFIEYKNKIVTDSNGNPNSDYDILIEWNKLYGDRIQNREKVSDIMCYLLKVDDIIKDVKNK